jgi:hypothetical protein
MRSVLSGYFNCGPAITLGYPFYLQVPPGQKGIEKLCLISLTW